MSIQVKLIYSSYKENENVYHRTCNEFKTYMQKIFTITLKYSASRHLYLLY